MENLQSDHLDTQNLYRDMQKRTGGEIYIGVVGPVRTGKSTFIKRFMDVAVLPYMEDAAQKTRAQDELPQSAGGRTITTTEPKFIPQEAVELKLAGEVTIRVRLVDCVGFMVEGAAGHLEDGAERLVKTPWYDHEIPFTQAAELGTRKVITDHSTIGVVVTTDGSFSDLPQETYLDAENQAISENYAAADCRSEVLFRTEAMVAEAAHNNITLLHENEKGIYGDNASRCLDLMQQFAGKHFSCTFDFANFIQCGQDPSEAYEMLSPYISYVHVKDALFATGEVVPAGTGDGHLPKIFQKLDASGYHGFLSLEPHLANFSGLAALEHNAAIRTESNTEKAFCVAWEAFQKVLG